MASDQEEQSVDEKKEEDEEPEEEEFECDECGRELDEYEAEENDGVCWDCAGQIKADKVRQRLPSNYEIRMVTGNHRKPCSDCGKSDWSHGDYYVFDSVNPWGTDKFCMDCAEYHDWGDDDDEESDEEEDPSRLFARGYNQRSERSHVDDATASLIRCHTGLDPRQYPTSGSMHIGGLSSAMVNPNLRKMSRNCERSNPNSRGGTRTQTCPGKIESFTEAGFMHATCNVCFLPAQRDESEINNSTSRKNDADDCDGNISSKRQRI